MFPPNHYQFFIYLSGHLADFVGFCPETTLLSGKLNPWPLYLFGLIFSCNLTPQDSSSFLFWKKENYSSASDESRPVGAGMWIISVTARHTSWLHDKPKSWILTPRALIHCFSCFILQTTKTLLNFFTQPIKVSSIYMGCIFPLFISL